MIGSAPMKRILTGLDVLRETSWSQLKGHRLGLLSNQASLDNHLTPAKDIIARLLPGHLKALYGPQHGFGSTEQDNMKETNHTHDPDLDVPVFSLYSEVREPTKEMLDPIDLLLIDLQDVGCRVYTFASTMLGRQSSPPRPIQLRGPLPVPHAPHTDHGGDGPDLQ
jgi:uncharacterized protein YbbC (DUF1343 family)